MVEILEIHHIDEEIKRLQLRREHLEEYVRNN